MGFPIWDLSPGRKLAIRTFAGRLRAEDVLRDHGPSMSAEDLHDWVLKATGSPDAAQEAFNARRAAELKSGQPVG